MRQYEGRTLGGLRSIQIVSSLAKNRKRNTACIVETGMGAALDHGSSGGQASSTSDTRMSLGPIKERTCTSMAGSKLHNKIGTLSHSYSNPGARHTAGA